MSNFPELLIASNNEHKAEEIKNILAVSSPNTKVYTLKDKGIEIDVVEDGDTLEENALKKAEEIFSLGNIPVISDDTGLFVEALRGKPGVYSARYAGEDATYEDNCQKVINELTEFKLKASPAYFKTVICLFETRKYHQFFEGVCNGQIITESRGDNGFGYDPIFIPRGYIKTFAELSSDEKNKISHRGKAVQELKKYLLGEH